MEMAVHINAFHLEVSYTKERRKEEEREAEYLSIYLVTVGGNLLFPCPLP
jgi:hypothetical protein